MTNNSATIKRIFHSSVVVFFVLSAHLVLVAKSYALPSKRIIIQLSHELSGQDEILFRQQLGQLVIPKHTATSQGSRWLLGIPSETSSEQLDALIAKISAMKGVAYAEEDKIIKPAVAPPVVNTQ